MRTTRIGGCMLICCIHSLVFIPLRAQGACVASIKPEYLMEPTDYKK